MLGKCPECGEWNSFVETVNSTRDQKSKTKNQSSGQSVKPLRLSEIKTEKTERILTGIGELDRVLGGGIVPGAVVLVAGDPGIGKSTLILNVTEKIGGLYVSGEESAEQIKIRAERLKVNSEKLRVITTVNVDDVVQTILEEKPKLVVVDSIQTMETDDMSGAAGSIGQVRECGQRLARAAKKLQIPLFIIGHVTKEGAIAGPKVLEHLVDTVLYLEGERYQNLRILRAVKNRFGATDEVGVFEMNDSGMREIKNPSGLFLEEEPASAEASARQGKTGSCIVCTLEGNRPILVEIQALVVPTSIPIPRRVVSGVDYNRVQLLCAIIQKYLKLPLYSNDVFISVTGGMKISEPGADLGICLAIISSAKNIPLPAKTVAIGEMGLLGEVRRVNQLERRIKEAQKMGYMNIISGKEQKSLYTIYNSIFK